MNTLRMLQNPISAYPVWFINHKREYTRTTEYKFAYLTLE